jgi:hypothetical protein
MTMPKHRIFATPFASVYPLYVQTGLLQICANERQGL